MVEEKKTTHVNEFLCENGKLIKYIGNSTDVIIPDGISEIGFYVFSDNNRIESVTIPDTIKVIPTAAFCNCTRLKKVQLGRNVEKILPYAFGGCESLEEIRIPGSVKVLDRVVFKGCISLKRVQLEEGLTLSYVLLKIRKEDGSPCEKNGRKQKENTEKRLKNTN